jgi:hypothetical protein
MQQLLGRKSGYRKHAGSEDYSPSGRGGNERTITCYAKIKERGISWYGDMDSEVCISSMDLTGMCPAGECYAVH